MEPTQLHAGDSVTWAREARAFPSADGWSLIFALRGPGSLDVASSDGEPYQFRMASSQTRDLPPGAYHWACFAVRDDERKTLGVGRLDILEDLLQAGNFDGRSHARRMLDLIEAALEKRIPKDQQSYEIDGMKLDRIPVERLEALRTRYRREVATEGKKRKSPFGRITRVRL
jgi:hypothetical protein